MIGLTPRQAELLAFIQKAGPVGPTVSEMCDAIGARSRGGVQQMLANLEGRGWIRRMPNRHQAIQVLRPLPAGLRAVPVRGVSAPSRANDRPTACAAPYPFVGHLTCADWREQDAL